MFIQIMGKGGEEKCRKMLNINRQKICRQFLGEDGENVLHATVQTSQEMEISVSDAATAIVNIGKIFV